MIIKEKTGRNEVKFMFACKRKVNKILAEAAPAPGVAPSIITFYNKSEGVSMIKVSSTASRSDTVDTSILSITEDGEHYERIRDLVPVKTIPQGTVRDYYRVSLVCPGSVVPDGRERLVMFSTKALLPTDNPLEGMMNWTLWYQVSFDGGRTIAYEKQVIQKGDEYNAMHSLRGVNTGKNCIMLGDHTELPCLTKYQKDPKENNKIILGVQISNTDENGNYYNPGSGFTFTYCALLHGKWDENSQLQWDLSEPIKISPDLSRRGLIEPAIAEMPDGRILMVMRGSNQGRNDNPTTAIPGYRWYSVSSDGGYTWSEAKPWLYDTQENFYSPSSCSQLLWHSNGKLYWIGNISESNPFGNMPRYPLVIGEVDPESLLLKKDSVSVVATREEDQSEWVTYSNFYAKENRVTKNIEINITPYHVVKNDPYNRTNAYIYEVFV
jgi:hypothetical protein